MNEWDLCAESWDVGVETRAYATAAFASLEKVLAAASIELEQSRVLDFGCGTGLLSELLVAAGATVEAIDTSTGMLEVLRSKIAKRGWTNVKTGTALPTEGAAFDLVLCSSVCSFLADYPGTVGELVKRLRPGGLFAQWDWERTGEDPHGLTKAEIQQALSQSGLVDVSVGIGFVISIDDQPMSPLMGRGQRPAKL